MAITKDKKREIVAKLTEAFKESTAVAFVGFTKLTVKDSSKMRTQLAEANVKFFVAKKTLIRKALETQGYTGTLPELPGEVAIAWTSGDVTAPTRGVYEFGKKLKGALVLLGGVFEKAFIDAAGAKEVATIPPMPVLRGMFVNVINSPIQGLVVALDKIREKKSV
jgi:large subunit ribosomal protein L10